VIPLPLASIAEITGASLGAGTDPGAVADSVVIDSRKAGPGSLFAALPGENVDGHDFAAAAIAAWSGGGTRQPPGRRARADRPRRAWAMAALARAVAAALPRLTIAGITGRSARPPPGPGRPARRAAGPDRRAV
jgi:UDP-N-acetylmuramoyl-tripeptide--D-alanyl-D-alanine ligase